MNIVFEIRTKTNQPHDRHALIGMYSQPTAQIIGGHAAVSLETVSWVQPGRKQEEKGSGNSRNAHLREGCVTAKQQILGAE